MQATNILSGMAPKVAAKFGVSAQSARTQSVTRLVAKLNEIEMATGAAQAGHAATSGSRGAAQTRHWRLARQPPDSDVALLFRSGGDEIVEAELAWPWGAQPPSSSADVWSDNPHVDEGDLWNAALELPEGHGRARDGANRGAIGGWGLRVQSCEIVL